VAGAVSDLFQEPDGTTPLRPEEREGLLQSWITQRKDLNEAEEENILEASAWARRQGRLKIDDLLTDGFVRKLHARMFGDVWEWAGQYRLTERNIGIESWRIPQEIPSLLSDVRYWIENKTYPPGEIAVRLHHRLVAVHPFPNGNGRHARLMADLLIERLGGKPFSWGGGGLADVGALRTRYVESLQAADNHDIGPLLAFARS
jgi:Fic-DOC domain mobile mystery protein B